MKTLLIIDAIIVGLGIFLVWSAVSFFLYEPVQTVDNGPACRWQGDHMVICGPESDK